MEGGHVSDCPGLGLHSENLTAIVGVLGACRS